MEAESPLQDEDIAIIGMACRVPGAPDKEMFWHNLRCGADSIQRPGTAELLTRKIAPKAVHDPAYVWASGQLADTEAFDAPFFGFSPREAQLMDPQHRHFLETSWAALEDAGYRPRSAPGTVGVFAGSSMNKYLLHNLLGHPELRGLEGWDDGIPPGSTPDAMPARVAYQLGLGGPSVSVLTACSSSLTAVCLAADSLQNFTCDMALAGGVAIVLPETPGYRYHEGGLISRDGVCRPYDADASGSVFGSGVGVIVLKRLGEAIADANHIYAVLRGWAINNDGRARAGYTAPGVDGQAAVVMEAVTAARLHPDDLRYIEGHGSATRVGDPIEVRALAKAFAAADGEAFCGLGSVKGNIGHLDAAAGIAGLIKTALAMTGDVIPATIHFTRPNPGIELAGSPFYIVADPTPWPEGVRRAGVSSFGMGGANAHVVLQEPPVPQPTSRTRPYELIPISAATEQAAQEACARLARAAGTTAANLADIAYTLTTGREELPIRRIVVAGAEGSAVAALTEGRRDEVYAGQVRGTGLRPLTMMFPGVGEPYADVALDLYQCAEVFRRETDRLASLAGPFLDADLRDVLFPSADWRAPWDGQLGQRKPSLDLRVMRGRAKGQGSQPTRTVYDQPATFALEYALAQQLMAWGAAPESMIGHSVGEYVAACLAGVFNVADALRIVIERAKLIGKLPKGGMLAVPLPEDEIARHLGSDVWLGAVNTPGLCVLSGSPNALAKVEAALLEKGVVCGPVRAEHAYHSGIMRGIEAELAAVVDTVTLNPPELPYLSGVTGTWVTETEATSSGYWTTHMCHTVRFANGIETLAQEPSRIYLEVGPGQALTAFTLSTLSDQRDAGGRVISTSQSFLAAGSAVRSALEAMGRIWTAGGPVDLQRLYDRKARRRIPLPAYPFERHRYWIERPGISHEETTEDHPRPEGTPAAAGGSDQQRETEGLLTNLWCELLGHDEIGVHEDFLALGGHSLLALQLANKLWNDHGIPLPHTAFLEHRTIHELAKLIDGLAPGSSATSLPAAGEHAALIARQVRQAVETALGPGLTDDQVLTDHELRRAAPELLIALKRQLGMPVYPVEIEEHPTIALLTSYFSRQWASWSARAAGHSPRDRQLRHSGPKVRSAGFILSSPRTGSTLLRVMLAGHPGLFCAPELHLLTALDMAERREAERGTDRNQGIQRALMELCGIDAEAAAARISEYEHRELPTAAVFRELADLAGGKLLIDKSPGYARYLEILQGIEYLVEDARYIHLLRHPYPVMDSMARNRFTQLMGAGEMDPYEFAEHIWTLYNANIREFLREVSPGRQCVILYENLVRDPHNTMTDVCQAFGIDFRDELLHPYEGRRMRDGLGDPNFLSHSAIDAELADTWRKVRLPRRLSPLTARLAQDFGYEIP
jgi:acyl transferase domain-containing protein